MAPKGTDILTRGQCRAARAFLDWSAQTLADRAGIHRITVQKFESGKSALNFLTAKEIRRTFESEGIEFVGDYGVHYRPKLGATEGTT